MLLPATTVTRRSAFPRESVVYEFGAPIAVKLFSITPNP